MVKIPFGSWGLFREFRENLEIIEVNGLPLKLLVHSARTVYVPSRIRSVLQWQILNYVSTCAITVVIRYVKLRIELSSCTKFVTDPA